MSSGLPDSSRTARTNGCQRPGLVPWAPKERIEPNGLAVAATQEIVEFIDARREDFGVEPICTVLRSAGVSVAPSTYYAAKSRRPSQRACRDAALGPALVELWKDNYCVYGARKLWKTARRAGHDVGRDRSPG